MHTEQTCVPVVPPAQSISSVNLDSSSPTLVVEASARKQASSGSNGTSEDSPQAEKELCSEGLRRKGLTIHPTHLTSVVCVL